MRRTVGGPKVSSEATRSTAHFSTPRPNFFIFSPRSDFAILKAWSHDPVRQRVRATQCAVFCHHALEYGPGRWEGTVASGCASAHRVVPHLLVPAVCVCP